MWKDLILTSHLFVLQDEPDVHWEEYRDWSAADFQRAWSMCELTYYLTSETPVDSLPLVVEDKHDKGCCVQTSKKIKMFLCDFFNTN